MTRSDLLALGFSTAGIKHRIASGRLHRVGQGVYAVGWPEMNRERRWMVAVLSCGAEAALSHRSAAALWEIGEELGTMVDVSVRRRSALRRPGMRVRTRPSLPAAELVRRGGIAVTDPARTLLDLATELGRAQLERAVNEADKLDLIDPEGLRAALGGFAGQPGVRALRGLLDRHAFHLSDSELESLFCPLATGAGLPEPMTKALVNGFEVDFFWPGLGLVVETDGLRYHRTPASQARDRLRDQTHTEAGLTTLRFTHWQVKHERARVQRVLRRAATNLR